jgi:hypothetical protein
VECKGSAAPTGVSPDILAAGVLVSGTAGVDEMPGYLLEHTFPTDEMGILGELDEVTLGGDAADTCGSRRAWMGGSQHVEAYGRRPELIC